MQNDLKSPRAAPKLSSIYMAYMMLKPLEPENTLLGQRLPTFSNTTQQAQA